MPEPCDLYRWPDWMPKPQRPDYSYEPVDRRSKTDMEVGSVLRVDYDTDETTLNCTLILNRFQASWFEAFERGALHQGSQWFSMPLQTGGFIEWHTVRFAARPKAGKLIGTCYTTYTLQLELERREGPMCDELAKLLVCILPEELLESSAVVKDFTLSLPGVCTIPDFWIYPCIKKRVRYEYGLL